MVPPFVRVGATWHLVVNWMPEMTADAWKLLRPLTSAETELVDEARRQSEFETWALLVPTDRARSAGRP